MRHNKHRHKLGLSANRRKHFLSNLAFSLITHGKIETTLARARALRPYVEKLITLGKKNTIQSKRLAAAKFQNKQDIVIKLFEKAQDYQERQGGYTRILKLADVRVGDGAPKAIIAFV